MISPRLCVNGGVCKFSEALRSECCLARFMPQSAVKQLTGTLRVTPRDLTHVVSPNLNLCWAARPVAGADGLVQVTYVLQCNSGGWIPRWAVESGMVDKHLVAIFKQITRWSNSNENQVNQDQEREEEAEGVEPARVEVAVQQAQQA